MQYHLSYLLLQIPRLFKIEYYKIIVHYEMIFKNPSFFRICNTDMS